MIYHYRAFGLSIRSELQCHEFSEIEGTPPADVSVRYGEVPGALDNPRDEQSWFQATEGELLLMIPNVAKYHIVAGTRITIEPLSELGSLTMRLYLYGSAFGALLHQRDLLVLHGSAAIVDDRCLVFVGPKGAGKSTIVATLAQQNHKVLTDDVCAVAVDAHGTAVAFPGYPLMKLCEDSVVALGRRPADYTRIRAELDKVAVPLENQLATRPAPVEAIFYLNTGEAGACHVSPIKGLAKVAMLHKNIYRDMFLRGLGIDRSHYLKCVELAKHVPCYELFRPAGRFTTFELSRVAQSQIHSPTASTSGVGRGDAR